MTRALVIAAIASVSSAAHAQPAGPEQATAHFDAGRRLLAEGKPGEACAEFEQAIKLDPTAAGTMLNLGLCNEQLHRDATALRWFRKAQARASETGLDEHERAAKMHTGNLSQLVPTVSITATSAPAGATIAIDGAVIDPTELAHVELDPGQHVVELHAPGHPDVRETISIHEGDHRALELMPAATPPSAPVDRSRAYWLLGGAAVAGGACLALGLYEQSAGGSDPSCAGGGSCSERDIQRYGGTTLFVGALVLAGFGGYYLFASPHEHAVAVAPVVSSHGGGLAAAWRF